MVRVLHSQLIRDDLANLRLRDIFRVRSWVTKAATCCQALPVRCVVADTHSRRSVAPSTYETGPRPCPDPERPPGRKKSPCGGLPTVLGPASCLNLLSFEQVSRVGR